jgi:hypothetical protein
MRGPGERLNELRHNFRTSKARELLRRYSAAKLVITSRLHCALPCLALGTPVVLLRRGVESDPRFDGLRELVRFHSDDSHPVKIDWQNPDPNPDFYLRYARELRERCQDAVRRVSEPGLADRSKVPSAGPWQGDASNPNCAGALTVQDKHD